VRAFPSCEINNFIHFAVEKGRPWFALGKCKPGPSFRTREGGEKEFEFSLFQQR
jgi:hypothetical protein